MNRTTIVGLCAAIALPAISLAAIPTQAAPAPITGTVFRDFNHDGINDATEPGWKGITVTATDPAGDATSVDTDAAGGYTIAGTDSETVYRVEFSWTEDWLEAGPIGVDNQSSIQFVNGGQAANFSVSNPSDYCEIADSLLGYATTCFTLGDPSAGSDFTDLDAVVALPSTSSGAAGQPGATPAMPEHLATNTVIGSTYGLSWQASSERLFTSAILKRHIGLGDAGIDGIYAVDTNADYQSSTSVWYSAIDAGTVASNTDRGLATEVANPLSADPTAFGQVYKVGWGDIDISQDEKTLYAVNLFDRNLYAIDVAQADAGSTSAHTNLGRPAHTCTNGVARPFALEIFDGNVWMSITCTAESGGTDSDLSAAVFSMDISSGQWAATPAMDIPLDYTKGCQVINRGCGFEPWIDVYSDTEFDVVLDNTGDQMPARPQPMVSDLEIDRDGYLIIGIRDRQGDQFGYRNSSPLDDGNRLTGASAGDILLASPNGDQTWTLEANGAAGTRSSAGVGTGNTGAGGANTNQGPGGGEFFWEDFVVGFSTNYHSELALGSLALAPGRTRFGATLTDPITDRLNAAGIAWFDSLDGSATSSYELFQNSSSPSSPTLGKANALGDMESMCPAAPIQIGNRVWFDSNSDGLQGPGELPIPGVTITIADEDPATSDDQVVTGTDGTWSYSANPNTKYSITVDASTAAVDTISEVGSAVELLPTSADAGAADLFDSDMDPSTLMIMVMTGAPGENNHSLDAGFISSGLELGNLVWLDTNNNGVAEANESGIPDVNVELWIDSNSNGTADTKIRDTSTDNDGHYNFAGLDAGSYFVKVPEQSSANEPLNGLASSTPTAALANNDSDNDDNGIDMGPSTDGFPGVAVISGGVELTSGSEPGDEQSRAASGTDDDSPNGLDDTNSNLSIDFGYYPLASLGNFVWHDQDVDGVQDSGELPFPGVTVSLCDSSMTSIQSLVTDADGHYLFENLPVGTYMVCFDLATLPSGYDVTSPNMAADNLDSDGDQNGKTSAVDLGPGEENLTLDLGIHQTNSDDGEVSAQDLDPSSGQDTPDPVVSGQSPIPRTGNNSTLYLGLFGSVSILLGSAFLALGYRAF